MMEDAIARGIYAKHFNNDHSSPSQGIDRLYGRHIGLFGGIDDVGASRMVRRTIPQPPPDARRARLCGHRRAGGVGGDGATHAHATFGVPVP